MSINVKEILRHVAALWPKSGWTTQEFETFGDGIGKIPVDTAQAEAAISEVRRGSSYNRPDMPKIIAACWRLVEKPKHSGPGRLRTRTADVYRIRQERLGITGKSNEEVIFFQLRGSTWSKEQVFQHAVECLRELDGYTLDIALNTALIEYPDLVDYAQDWLDRAIEPSKFARKKVTP